MSVIDRPAIVATPDTCGGEVRFEGTRVPLRTVLNALHEVVGPDEVSAMYPSLPAGWHALLVELRPFLRRTFREDIR